MQSNLRSSSSNPRGPGSSPPTERVVAVLDLLSAPDAAALSGAEITRRLGLQKSTCHGILKSLSECGFLVRSDSDRTYSLGPRLIDLGSSAEARFPWTKTARPVLERLHRTLGLGCALATTDEDSLVIVDRFGGDESFPTGLQTGDRFPLVAPYGAVLLAWRDDDSVTAWLDAAPELSRAQTRDFRRALGTIRNRGYGAWKIAGMESLLRDLRSTISELRENPRGAGLRSALAQTFEGLARSSDLIPSRGRKDGISVGIATAPVFDDTGGATHEIELHVYRENLRAAEFDEMMQQLLSAAEELTRAAVENRRAGLSAGEPR